MTAYPPKNKDKLFFFLAISICIFFFIAYSVLSIVRHNNYQSFGFDLGINSQIVWRYSNFQNPISSIGPYPDKTKLYSHVELVYPIISPLYWIWESRKMLLIAEIAVLCSGGMAAFLLARRRDLTVSISLSILVGYLAFFGVQNAVWFDVHSASFAAGFLAWFIYFLDTKNRIWSIVFFLLSITAKENIALITFCIAFIYYLHRRDKLTFAFMALSFSYMFFIFFIYFPHIMKTDYQYQNSEGLLSNLNPVSFFDTHEKRKTFFFSIYSFGSISLFTPLCLIPIIADLATYFVVGSDLTAAHGLFMHYRVTLAPLLMWSAIITISTRRFLNNKYVALYILASVALIQYGLHLPLSYLTKSWFWQEPASVKTINKMVNNYLPENASVVSQNNITPHISHRDKIYTLYPEKKDFHTSSPCQHVQCDWFRWFDHPEYLIVDTDTTWDSRHYLIDRKEYMQGLENLEKTGVVEKYREEGTTILYKIVKDIKSIN